MGPKKKDIQKTTPKKKLPEFPIKDRKSLKKYAIDRNCFSLVIHTEQITDDLVEKKKQFSSPEIPVRLSRIKWPPLDIFTPVSDKEVPRVTIWRPFTKSHLAEITQLNEKETCDLIESVLPSDYSIINKVFLINLIYDVLRWAQSNNFEDKKISSLLGMYINTHNYFLGSTRRNQKEIYSFFKESILLHTIDDPPKSASILTPFECKSGLLYFCHTYLPVLPLLRVQLFQNYQLKLQLATPNA